MRQYCFVSWLRIIIKQRHNRTSQYEKLDYSILARYYSFFYTFTFAPLTLTTSKSLSQLWIWRCNNSVFAYFWILLSLCIIIFPHQLKKEYCFTKRPPYPRNLICLYLFTSITHTNKISSKLKDFPMLRVRYLGVKGVPAVTSYCTYRHYSNIKRWSNVAKIQSKSQWLPQSCDVRLRERRTSINTPLRHSSERCRGWAVGGGGIWTVQ